MITAQRTCAPECDVSNCPGVSVHRISAGNYFARLYVGSPKHIVPFSVLLWSVSLMATHLAAAVAFATLSSANIVPPRVVMPLVTAVLLCLDAAWVVLIEYRSARLKFDIGMPLRVCVYCAVSTSIIGLLSSICNLALQWNLLNLIVVYSIVSLFTGFAFAYLAYIYWDYWRQLHAMALAPVKQA